MTDSETKALIEYYIANHEFLFFLLGNHDCVTMDTECLTRRGWLHYHDLTIDDEVLGYNVSTQQAEWQPISVMFKKPYNGEMVSVDNLHVDMMVTPGHRLLHKKGTHSQGWGYITAGEMDQDLPVILNAAQVKTGGVELTDDQLRLAGWLLTDAHYPNDGAVWIYQSKPESVDHITALLGRLGIAYTHHQRDRAITQICGTSLVNAPMTCHEFYIKAGPGRDLCKQLVPDRSRCPEWAMALTAEQFRVFFDTIVEGDGTWDGAHPHDKTCAVVYKSKTFLDSLQIALVTHGWRASVRQDNRNHWRLTTALRPETILTWSRNTKRVPAPENTEVWCLSVPLTNFMVRRNGKAYFTGNCWQNDGELLINVYKAIHDGGIIKAHQQKVRLLFPNGRSVIINARHKFPGSSMWMTQFGQLKTAHLDGQADIYVGGDKHVSGYSNGVHPGTKKMFHALQVASYKVLDEYPVELGLLPRDLYVCPVAIISPNARDDINLIRWEFDPFEGAERLKWERSRH